ncbi:MAG TPA: hypothetical protein VH092_31530 [Urbifossiella sp.]|nr:hypothetical protein [Urbifossiella sp.]
MTLRIAAALGLAAALAAAGCEKSNRIAVYKTSGKLVRSGAPVAGLAVIFHPTDPSAPTTPLRPNGVVNADGTFALTCYNQHDGAPPGEYVVTVSEAPRNDSDPRPVLPATKYRDVKTSPLRARIEAKSANELTPFDITN